MTALLPRPVPAATLLSVGATVPSTPPGPAVCAATRILTPNGPRAAGALRPGDAVCTAEGKAALLRNVARHCVDVATLRRHAGLAPVRIRRGALGEGRPWRDLAVSPAQLLRLEGCAVEEFCGADSLLVPASLLVDGLAVTRAGLTTPVRYVTLAITVPGCLWAEGLAAHPADGLHAESASPCPGDRSAVAAARMAATPGVAPCELRALMAYFARRA